MEPMVPVGLKSGSSHVESYQVILICTGGAGAGNTKKNAAKTSNARGIKQGQPYYYATIHAITTAGKRPVHLVNALTCRRTQVVFIVFWAGFWAGAVRKS